MLTCKVTQKHEVINSSPVNATMRYNLNLDMDQFIHFMEILKVQFVVTWDVDNRSKYVVLKTDTQNTMVLNSSPLNTTIRHNLSLHMDQFNL